MSIKKWFGSMSVSTMIAGGGIAMVLFVSGPIGWGFFAAGMLGAIVSAYYLKKSINQGPSIPPPQEKPPPSPLPTRTQEEKEEEAKYLLFTEVWREALAKAKKTPASERVAGGAVTRIPSHRPIHHDNAVLPASPRPSSPLSPLNKHPFHRLPERPDGHPGGGGAGGHGGHQDYSPGSNNSTSSDDDLFSKGPGKMTRTCWM